MPLHLLVEKRDSLLLWQREVHLLEPEVAFDFPFALLGLGIDRRTIAELRLIPVVHGDEVIDPVELLPTGSEGAGGEIAREWLLFDVIPARPVRTAPVIPLAAASILGGVGFGSGGGARPCSWFLVPGSWFLVPGSWCLVPC